MKYGFVFVAKLMNDSSRERMRPISWAPYIFGFMWVCNLQDRCKYGEKISTHFLIALK